MPVGRVDEEDTHGDEDQQHADLDHHDDVVDAGGLRDPDHQQGGHEQDAAGAQQVEAVSAAEQGRAARSGAGLDVGGGELHRDLQAEVRQQAGDVAAPTGGHGGGGDAVFQHQQPAHDPGEDLAQRGVGIGVGRPRHRHARRQLGVAQAGKGAGEPRHHERQDHRRPGIVRRRVAGHYIDARPDDAADAQEYEVDRPQGAFEVLVAGLVLDLLDRLLDQQTRGGGDREVRHWGSELRSMIFRLWPDRGSDATQATDFA